MFARKISLTLVDPAGARKPVPLAWMEQFFLRDFTGSSAFDETLPASDGVLEAGLQVDAETARAGLEKWLKGRRMIGPETRVDAE